MNTPTERLGRYRLVRRLAAGGMGEVYLAEADGAANFTKQVAIKRILPHLAQDAGFVRKFIDEAHLMVQLHHGNIVPVLELADDGGELYLVMEYLPGRDLKAVIHRLRARDEQMPVDIAVWLVAEVLAGLDYAHRKRNADDELLGVVHRDVSPSNICLGAQGAVKLTDFGIARARGGLHQSISGTLQGKFVYMSPEQADGRAVDARSDVFSAGLVLYELLTDTRPFAGESETETLRRVRQCEVPRPSSLRADVTETLCDIIMKALARDPDDRYGSAAEMRRALAHHLAVQSSEADAHALGALLSRVFPEGVVPKGAPKRSFDDALLAQLGTGSGSGTSTRTASASAGMTRTPTPYAATSTDQSHRSGRGALMAPPSGPSFTPSVQDPLSMPEASVSDPGPPGEIIEHTTAQMPAGGGRRRWVVLGLLIGLGAAGAFALWPRSAHLEPVVNPPDLAGVIVEVDGARLMDGSTLQAGRTYKVCVSATGHAPDCHQMTLAPGLNTPTFSPSPVPTLAPEIAPAEAAARARVLLDDARVKTLPVPLDVGRSYTLCVEADGFETECQLVNAVAGLNAPRIELKARLEADAGPIPDAEPVAPPVDAGVPDAAPIRRPVRSGPRFVVLDSTPGAMVWRGNERVGPTPQRVRVGPRAATYEFRAEGFASTRRTIRPNHRAGQVKVALERPGFLTLRTYPPASEIRLDGRRIGAGVIKKFPAAPGPHTLLIRYTNKAGRTFEVGPKRVNLDAGRETNLKEIRVPIDDSPGDQR